MTLATTTKQRRLRITTEDGKENTNKQVQKNKSSVQTIAHKYIIAYHTQTAPDLGFFFFNVFSPSGGVYDISINNIFTALFYHTFRSPDTDTCTLTFRITTWSDNFCMKTVSRRLAYFFNNPPHWRGGRGPFVLSVKHVVKQVDYFTLWAQSLSLHIITKAK